MKVNEIVGFSKESFFNGAVQTEWFYDESRVEAIAESYVFHGPKYYGVSNADIKAGEHRLLDTASFAKNLTDKIYSIKPDNSFVMTIAGYGTGKSHLAVCLGALFANKGDVSKKVIENISTADAEIGEYIRKKVDRRNLVIVLNGMNNFNLDAEVLSCSKKALASFGISDDLLKKLTKSYDIARHFVDRMFEMCQDKFDQSAKANGFDLRGTALKNYLISHVETDGKVLDIINAVYQDINGDKIAWDRGLSAGDVLLTLQEELCGEDKPFNKILLLFDEFGRYIEYTASNPAIAGEAALQQIFEAIQSANGKIIFAGFIQSELKAYLARIEKTANITRYIDRYRTACENLFLSSNFETILANILKKKNPGFERVVGTAVERYANFHSRVKSSLSRWDRSAIKKSVWTNDNLYNSVVLKGCYPLHPITTWLLSGSHQWMQQRSTLAFAAEMFDQVAPSEIDGTWLPYVYPVQIIDSGIFNEMLNSEEKGLVSSQYCMLYRDIIVKIGDKLSELEKTVLKAVLIVNMGRMAFRDKDDAMTAIRYCSNVSEDEVKHALNSLEELHGVVAFDDHAKTYDLIAEANGFNEFKRIYAKYRLGVTATIDDLDEDVLSQVNLTVPVETSFAQERHIFATEWGFDRFLIHVDNIDEDYLRNAIRTCTDSSDGEKMRGLLIYAYCNQDADKNANKLTSLYNHLQLKNYPIIMLFLNDSDNEVISGLAVKKALQKFSLADRERFKKHITDTQRAQNNKIIRKITGCVSQRAMIGATGIETYSVRINALCTQRFVELYTKAVPFPFDGFENKVKVQAKGTLTSICVGLLNQTLMNEQVYSSLTPKDKNRVNAVMSTKAPYSWKIFNESCRLVEPQHPIVREIISEVVEKLESGDKIAVFNLFGKYLLAPYGLNDNSLALLVSYFVAFYGNRYIYTIANERLCEKHWSDAKGKLKTPEIKKISIQKNANVDVDLVSELCKKILATRSVEACVTLKQDLDALIEQEGETNQNKFIVAEAKSYLNEGIRIKAVIYEKASKVQTTINEAKEKFSIIKVVRALESLPTITTVIEEGYSFEYSTTYCNLVEKLRGELMRLLEQSFMRTILKIKCDITELSQFKNTYSKIGKSLRDLGLEEYANATDDRIKMLESELLAKQRYESSLVECEKDLTISTTASGYRELDELKKKLTGWLTFIQTAKDMPSSVSDPLKLRIEKSIASLNQSMFKIEEDYKDTISSLTKAETTTSLKYIDGKLERLLQLNLPELWVGNIVVVRESISLAISYIESLPRDMEMLLLAIDQITEGKYTHCTNAVKCSAYAIKKALLEEEYSWMTNNVEYMYSNCETLTLYECTSWLERTSVLPTCLSNSSKERYKHVRTLVERHLREARIEGVLSMYDALSDEEKIIFKQLLAKR